MGTDNLHSKRKAKLNVERRQAKREPYGRVLIVCEDSESSPAYLKAMCDELKLSTANIMICGKECGSAPINVVDYAIKNKEEYDKVYCVIDRDQHWTFNKALQKAKSKKVEMIVSIPCFEYWLLLHFEFTDQPFQAVLGSHCDTVVSKLKPHLHDYDKSKLKEYYQFLKLKQPNAIERAKQRENACQHEDLGNKNPYTQLHHLVEYLENLKRLKSQKTSKSKHLAK